MNICVVALGKIGLPLAVQCAAKGHRVTGADVDAGVVALVNEGTPPFPGEADLDVKLKTAVAAGLLRATTDTTAAVCDADAVLLVVPLFVGPDGTPDFGWLDAATRAVPRGCDPAPWSATRRLCRWAPPGPAGRRCSQRVPGWSPARTSLWSSAPNGC
ncbi:MAG: hypothetical protein ABIS86_08680 [Streptosporangiaceae bacterium]